MKEAKALLTKASVVVPGESRWTIMLINLALVLAAALAASLGAFRTADSRLEALTFSALSRPASGQIHVVELDAASMAAIRRWPWPRDHYARLVAQLDAAGARSISFDVDFSSAGDAAGDRAFAAAIAAARAPVALPTFAQNATSRDRRQLDSLPIPVLREHAHLASVSVAPDGDGLVRRLPLGMVTGATARPALSVFVAGRAGAVGQSFPVDFAIDPATLPRHSFVAVERGAIRPGSLAGKDVIVGATAIEFGDRYLVPRHGVIAGVIIQALAAETLLGGVPIFASWPALVLLAALLALPILASPRRQAALVRAVAALAGLTLVWIAARVWAGLWFELVPALALLMGAGMVRFSILSQRLAAAQRRIDPESSLPNRLALDSRPDAAQDRYLVAAQIDDFDGLKLAVDSDNFGPLVRRISERLKVASGGPVYRSEDRTLVWTSLQPIDEIEAQIAGIRALMRSPFELDGRRLGVSLTFGVAACSTADPAANAAHAASLAKRTGRFWRLHSDNAGEAATEQFSLLGELEGALRDRHIAVLYQPKLNLATGRVDAAEALVRWNHPVRGLLPPDGFIPLFEEAGRIDDLTLAVLALALEDMALWRDGGLTIGVAVNISAALLGADSFADRALAQVAQAGALVQQLTFEVTESAQFEDVDKAIATLRRFRAAGIRISMDDYGTGQSTLNYLKLLPLSELKIDRMFVAHAHIDRGDAMLVRSTVQLAHELGLKVVAEGIEEADCLAFLRQIGCDYAQGYFIGRPLAAAALAAAAASAATEAAPLPAVRAA